MCVCVCAREPEQTYELEFPVRTDSLHTCTNSQQPQAYSIYLQLINHFEGCQKKLHTVCPTVQLVK